MLRLGTATLDATGEASNALRRGRQWSWTSSHMYRGHGDGTIVREGGIMLRATQTDAAGGERSGENRSACHV